MKSAAMIPIQVSVTVDSFQNDPLKKRISRNPSNKNWNGSHGIIQSA